MTAEAAQVAQQVEVALIGHTSFDAEAVDDVKKVVGATWPDAEVWTDWERRGPTMAPEVVLVLKVRVTSLQEPRAINIVGKFGMARLDAPDETSRR
jgi:hypothetical protein